jgi:hypothetical protein
MMDKKAEFLVEAARDRLLNTIKAIDNVKNSYPMLSTRLPTAQTLMMNSRIMQMANSSKGNTREVIAESIVDVMNLDDNSKRLIKALLNEP